MRRYTLTRWSKCQHSSSAYHGVDSTRHWTLRIAEREFHRLRAEHPDSVFSLDDRWLGAEVYNWLSTDRGPVRRWGGWLHLSPDVR